MVVEAVGLWATLNVVHQVHSLPAPMKRCYELYKIDLLVFDRPPQPLDGVIAPGAAAIHADRDVIFQKQAGDAAPVRISPLLAAINRWRGRDQIGIGGRLRRNPHELGRRASDEPRWPATLLRCGDHDCAHLAGCVSPRIAPNRGSDRVDRSPAWSCSRSPDHSTLSRRAECGSGNDSSGRFYAGKRSLSLRPAASWAITCRASARGSDCRDLQIRGGVGVARAKGLWDYGPACGGPSETDGVLPPVLRANA
jgi:hypothetical protein